MMFAQWASFSKSRWSISTSEYVTCSPVITGKTVEMMVELGKPGGARAQIEVKGAALAMGKAEQ